MQSIIKKLLKPVIIALVAGCLGWAIRNINDREGTLVDVGGGIKIPVTPEMTELARVNTSNLAAKIVEAINKNL